MRLRVVEVSRHPGYCQRYIVIYFICHYCIDVTFAIITSTVLFQSSLPSYWALPSSQKAGLLTKLEKGRASLQASEEALAEAESRKEDIVAALEASGVTQVSEDTMWPSPVSWQLVAHGYSY